MGAKYESYLVSDVDELELSVLAVVPQKKPYRAVVQLVHGMSEHKERYLPFMEYLAEQGYVSVIHDHRGHGKSIRGSADLGYMYGGGAEAIVRDIGLVNRKIRAELSGIPLILMGHSMGLLQSEHLSQSMTAAWICLLSAVLRAIMGQCRLGKQLHL